LLLSGPKEPIFQTVDTLTLPLPYKAARELLAVALPGVAVEIEASHAERSLMLHAKVPATAVDAAHAEIGKLPIGFEIAYD
jgi:hypothetical protein